ncbi:Protein of unknown function [Hymenobacter daecheongensis DSM 21074]|uniref:DUF4199 domain-containing protein n=1 Tax=Hymenobacter daecheongensis DSM 21074 TaxID=1121955 RepID=A0A1M6KYH9_9BACT|nr:DUF4199 domain-containing protein [Hymenobacter daecheongensis]SHJ64000.1 Protein of unknown function [Hymenobacter daecheongensis DSM 21074]
MNSSVAPDKPVTRTALRFGLAAGILSGLWVVGLYLTHNDPFGPKKVMAMVLLPLAVLVGQWSQRAYFQPDGPGIKRAIGVGMLITLLTATLSAASVYGLAQAAGPAQLARSKAEMIKIAEGTKPLYLRQKGGKEQYERTIQGLQQLDAQSLMTDDFIKKLLVGLLLSVPGGIFFRK